MSTHEKEVAAAQAYEDTFVPALFQGWTGSVARAARIALGQRVLDVACGTGILSREVSARVGTGGFVAALDLSPGMLAVARQCAPNVEFREGRAESLPWEAESFDAVVSQFGMMFFSDRIGAAREMLRVLVPGGRIAIAVWGAISDMPAFAAEVELFERVAGGDAAGALRAPFRMGDPREVTGILAAAGASSIEIATPRVQARFPTIESLVEADLRGWLPVMGVVLGEATIQRVLQEAHDALASHVTSDGSLSFETVAHVATATKP
jgi:SAM-dependent methyltransferase